MTSSTTYTVRIGPDKDGVRLDRALADAVADVSRSRLKALIVGGLVQGDGGAATADPAYRVRAGQTFAVTLPLGPTPTPLPQAIPLDIVYEDDQVIVVDKPAGLVVHPGAGNPDHTLVNALLAHCPGGLSSIGAPLRPGIVHRLDKDTSGLIVVAKTDGAHLALARQFAAHSIERVYYALVWGQPAAAEGRIDGNVARDPVHRRRMTVVARGGRTARTDYRVVAKVGHLAALLECRPATGRTHQIRVHLASLGHPLIGDPVYGRGHRRIATVPTAAAGVLAAFRRQALHAFLIGFWLPGLADPLRFRTELPNDIRSLIVCLNPV